MKYLFDKSLNGDEFRLMTLLNHLLKDQKFVQIKNRELGDMINKTPPAIAKIMFNLNKKKYIKIKDPSIYRKIYILK